jgi:hypothetical protein
MAYFGLVLTVFGGVLLVVGGIGILIILVKVRILSSVVLDISTTFCIVGAATASGMKFGKYKVANDLSTTNRAKHDRHGLLFVCCPRKPVGDAVTDRAHGVPSAPMVESIGGTAA